MRKNVRKQIRLSEELLTYINEHYDNASQFIREALREKVEREKQKTEHELTFVEIRARNQFTYSARLKRVIDGDTLELSVDPGFFITIETKVRLADIDCAALDTEQGMKARQFIEEQLRDAHLIIETRKKERYGRYPGYIYYSALHDDFESIIRHGKMINEELVKAGLALEY